MLTIWRPVYQVFFRWKTEDEIVEELLWDWDQLDDTDFPDTDASLWTSEKTRMEKKNRLLLLVAGLDHTDTKYEDKKNLPIPNAKDDIKICREIQDKLDKGFEIHSGRGRMFLDDRMYVRKTLAVKESWWVWHEAMSLPILVGAPHEWCTHQDWQ